MKRVVLSSIVVTGAVAAIGWFSLSGSAGGSFAYRDAEIVAEGRVLYDENCAACHGADLKGQPNWRDRDADGYLPAPPHDQTGHTWHHPDAQLIEITRLGTEEFVGDGYRSNMAGFGDVLSDEQIVAILAYIKSTWPPQIIARHDQLNAAYEEANRP